MFVVMAVLLFQRIFTLQIVQGEDKQQEFIRLRQMSRPEPDSPEMGLYARLLGRLDYLEWWFRENPWRAG